MHESLRRQLRPDSRVLVIIFLAVSLPILLGAGYMTYRSLWFKYATEQTQGRITEIRSGVPKLEVEYRNPLGQRRELISVGSDLYKNYVVGDAVTVYYDANNPAVARLDLFVEMWLFPVLLGVFGGFFLLPVVFMGGGEIRQWLTRGNLDRDGMVIQAEYLGFGLTVDPDIMGREPGAIGALSLRQTGNQYTLMHNGKQRDPLDPVVQRELGLKFIVRASWRHPKNGMDYVFESDPVSENPQTRIRSGRVAVKVDPDDPKTYRFEPPFGPAPRLRRRSLQ